MLFSALNLSFSLMYLSASDHGLTLSQRSGELNTVVDANSGVQMVSSNEYVRKTPSSQTISSQQILSESLPLQLPFRDLNTILVVCGILGMFIIVIMLPGI